MLFVQARFIIFFVIVFAVHWALRGMHARKLWLLLASHFFYACLFLGGPDSASADQFPPITFIDAWKSGGPLPIGWWFPFVLWASTIMDYCVGLGIGRSAEEWKRRAWLLGSLVTNLGVLAFFKYYNFGIDSVQSALAWFGLHTSKWTLSIFLPYGISFYTFQSMSYSIDVYRRRLEPVRSFLDLAFFISYFPPLVAGPIVRAASFLPQVFEPRRWATVEVRSALTLFFIGFVKKACISENVAPVADAFFGAPGKFDTLSGLIGVSLYAVQIYCDFSGYTDMAIACSRLLGYELTINFNFPYFARNISDFWRRWHISLSTWLRDYLYISLGGNRGSRFFVWRNLMLTMLLGGLWHGASWTFVIWGGLHGAALIVHREWEKLTAPLRGRGQAKKERLDASESSALHADEVARTGSSPGATGENESAAGAVALQGSANEISPRSLAGRVFDAIAIPVTFYWILITWIFFRAQPVISQKTGEVRITAFGVAREALEVVTGLGDGKREISRHWLWIFALLALLHFANSRRWFARVWARLPDEFAYACLGAGLSLALFFVQAKFKPFIYFQF